MSEATTKRRLPIGAEAGADAVHFRVWAPAARKIRVAFPTQSPCALSREANGYFSGLCPGIGAGARYGFLLDDNEKVFPDPVSRFQPDGPEGWSEVIANDFQWHDQAWGGIQQKGQVFYELHVGTFTPEGTLAAAMGQLPRLKALGITTVELMPLATFPGRFGWGYDGVDLFAPHAAYGRPDDVRRFVDTAHGLGLGVLLDVVYNHLGPDGNYLPVFSPHYFSDRFRTDWGPAINFSLPAVREFFISNAGYWIEEFHFDGLRLDATQAIVDASSPHILQDLQRAVRDKARGRATLVIAENDAQEAHYVRIAGINALWNDDFHHSAHVALTGSRDGYYNDFLGSPQELLSAVKYGFLFQGQLAPWQKKQRGESAFDLRPTHFVSYLENHDQVAHSARGRRLFDLAHPGDVRALTVLWLLSPQTPLFFQGQEYGTRTPFLFFADHDVGLAPLVKKGRGEFLRTFEALDDPAMQAALDDPSALATFQKCQLGPAEQNGTYRLHATLLGLRRGLGGVSKIDGAVIGSAAFALRFFDPQGDRLLLVNLGATQHLPAAEPLLAAPQLAAAQWRLILSSEDPDFDGSGTAPEWGRLGAHAAVLWGANGVMR